MVPARTVVVLLLTLAPVASIQLRGEKEDECSEREKKKYEIMFCKSATCTTCCDTWCKDTCQSLKDSMDSDECACDKDPEAFTEESYCTDKAEKYHDDHKDDVFEEQMA